MYHTFSIEFHYNTHLLNKDSSLTACFLAQKSYSLLGLINARLTKRKYDSYNYILLN